MAFDLDDTLTPAKSAIDPLMAGLLAELLTRLPVGIISGASIGQFRRQVLAHLPAGPAALAALHLMPACGTQYYRWADGRWQQVYAESLSAPLRRRIRAVLLEGARELGPGETRRWGELIEDRGSQITFSALGHAAPPEVKRGWDPDGTRKQRLVDYAARHLPECEVRAGGTTSVDVTRRGIDKAHGIRALLAALDLEPGELLFLGDRLEPGGNDHPVLTLGVRCRAVSGWPETACFVGRFLTGSD